MFHFIFWLMQLTSYDRMAREAADCLEQLIRIPSLSRHENEAADFLETYLRQHGAVPHRHGNNIWCIQDLSDATDSATALSTDLPIPTLLLNAHIDTVKPASGWQHDPFTPTYEGDRLYGLGSNDCGGGLVTLMQVFLALRHDRLPYRLVFLASAEEEVSGKDGIEAVLPLLPPIDVAIVGEPTQLQPALAEKGLMVLDCTAYGISGHAARHEGVNAIYQALTDIEWFRTYRFPKVSPFLDEVKMSVTMIEAGSQHNVVPDRCSFVVDVRSNECYTNLELLTLIQAQVGCEVHPRSTRLSSSRIATNHPLVKRALALGLQPFGSPTLSDQALMPFPSFKLGPGDSARSHTADEYISLSELRQAVETYTLLIRGVE